MIKDYYKILGINEFDSAENIKAAYRKMARKWHPDVAGNSEEAIIRFKEINEAYETLSNLTKKAEYDRARHFYSYIKNGSAGSGAAKENTATNHTEKKTHNESGHTNEKKNFKFSWEDFLSKKQRKNSYNSTEKSSPQKGEDIYTDVEITLLESIHGTEKTINMLQNGVCPKCGGRKFINGAQCTHCHGTGKYTSYKKFTVKIPAGIKNMSKIRLAREGGSGLRGGINGDLYITIHIKEPLEYKTDGLNILRTVPITPYEAVLGADIKIHSMNCEYTVKIAPNTQNGQKIRLSGCGIMQDNRVGDMIITLEIRIPRNLTGEEIALYKKLESVSSGNIRENI